MADRMWGIHAGRTGDAGQLFLKQGYVAIGWDTMGDISRFGPDRDALREAVAKTFPEKPAGAIPIITGQLYRFVHDLKPGDRVVYPSKQDRMVHIGHVVGPYEYSPATSPGYPNLRKAAWDASAPRAAFSAGALYEIGSAMSLFRVKTFEKEFVSALSGKVIPASVDEDPDSDTVAQIAGGVEESAEDFVVRRISQELKGHGMAQLVADVFRTMGFRTRTSPPGADGGIDIVAHRDELGLEPPIIKVQVKSSPGSVGDPEVSAFSAKVGDGEHGLFVTLGGFSAPAATFAKSKPALRLMNGSEFVELLLEHYDQLDPRFKTLIPLKRVYVPSPQGYAPD